MEALLITRQDLVKYTAVNGAVDTDSFIQWIKVAQDIHIQNYLGTDLFNKLKADVLFTISNTGIPTTTSLTAGGTGYTNLTGIACSGGTGSGFGVDITTAGNAVVSYVVSTAGTGYTVGDVLTIQAGNADATITVDAIDEIQQPYLNLLTTYVKPCLIHWAMVEYLPFSAFTIANKGVFKHGSENATNVEKSELEMLIEKQRQIAQNYTQRLIDHLVFNSGIYPEYNTNSNGDIFPDSNNYNIGWVL
jgi:hypothetical protein